jgi:prepilin-type processing-associated H-X9-DG protein
MALLMLVTGSTIMKASRSSEHAFTLFELLIVVFTFAILGAVLLASLPRRRSPSTAMRCINNLKQVGQASRTWALGHGDSYPMSLSVNDGGTMELIGTRSVFMHFMVMSNELNTPKILFCPEESRTTRTPATTFQSTVATGFAGQVPFTNDNNISYFVGVDADAASPNRILCGDRRFRVNGSFVQRKLLNLRTNSTLEWAQPLHQHDGADLGNVGFADGSVQAVKTSRLKGVLIKTAMATNRWDLP